MGFFYILFHFYAETATFRSTTIDTDKFLHSGFKHAYRENTLKFIMEIFQEIFPLTEMYLSMHHHGMKVIQALQSALEHVLITVAGL